MAELVAFTQSSLLLSPRFQCKVSSQRQVSLPRSQVLLPATSPGYMFSTRSIAFPTISSQQKQFSLAMRASIVSDAKVPTTFTADSAGPGIDVLPDSGGSNDDFGAPGGNGGGGENNGGDGSEGRGGSDGNEDHSEKKGGMSMSQKLTLGYAALVGLGGVVGFLKSGSQKSLLAGGLSASLLYYVYNMLPTSPVLASSIGLGLSAALLGVMGSRFKRSGKMFPAGVVSIMSFVMTGGYLHGIFRSMH